MNTYKNQNFRQFFDRDSRGLFQDIVFDECTFDNCALSLTKDAGLRSTVRNVRLNNCVSVSCGIGPAIFDELVVDGLDNNDLLIMRSPLFRHVTFKGKIGKLKIITAAHHVDRSPEFQSPFDVARASFYESLDWALDIKDAAFADFGMQGVPARLVRRDPETQVVVTREKALSTGWREKLSSTNTHWPFVIDLFLGDGEPDVVLVAPKGAKKQKFIKLREELQELRMAGVAEKD
jgi:hypothetical protein